MENPQINILVPLYNEEAVFGSLISRLQNLIKSTALSIEVILIDDGSTDSTPLLIKELAMSDEKFQAVFLSRNFGHQMALSAGLKYFTASEAIFIIDGDLQDPPELLEELYLHYKKGYDVVYAVRKKRRESWLMRKMYSFFYRFLKKISYIDIPLDTGDFSLISTRVAKHLNRMPEESRFLRGMRSWIGYKQIGIEYERSERQSGESKYTIKRLFELALNGIFNFSVYPVKFITNLGLFTIIVSVAYFLYTAYVKIFLDGTPQGFTALLFVIILFGGIQMLSLGLIGEYVLRIFFQVKDRPLFIVRERIVHKESIDG